MKDLFLLYPDITFLNFGSFGACPKSLFNHYQQIQLELEREPVQFIVKTGMNKLNEARKRLAEFIGCEADDLVYVTNPSYAVNTIAKSFDLKVGDEILSTNLEYGAMVRTWDYYCEKAGARFVQQKINLPIASKEGFIDDFWKGYTSKTKAIFISQITSSTALILPVKEICIEAKKRGLITIVDGAHVPGHIPLNMSELQADIYTGACHKWMMAPKGASFLYVRKEFQHWVDPLLISWGYKSDNPGSSAFVDYHQTAGTRDFSAFLTVPYCIDFMIKHNWKEKSKNCQNLVLKNATKMQEIFGFTPISPICSEFIGQMFSIPIITENAELLHNLMYEKYKIEIPVTNLNDKLFIRFSVQVFNEQKDLDYLVSVLKILESEKIISFAF